MTAPAATPRGLQPFDPVEDFDLELTRDHIALQRVDIQHGTIHIADASGQVKNQAQETKAFFGYVLAVGPGRIDGTMKNVGAPGEPVWVQPRRAMTVQPGDFVMCDGRLMFHHTPSHSKVFIGTEDVVIGRFKPDSKGVMA